jgi:hypothetical protein
MYIPEQVGEKLHMDKKLVSPKNIPYNNITNI